MKITVKYYDAEVVTEIPETAEKKANVDYVLASTHSKSMDKIAIEVIQESVKAIINLRKGEQ